MHGGCFCQARQMALPHLTSPEAESILAQACENESNNAKRMRIGLEALSVGTSCTKYRTPVSRRTLTKTARFSRYTGWAKKVNPKCSTYNFIKYWPILKILSPLQSPENLQCSGHKLFHHTSNASLHYLVKCLCQKSSVFCAMWRIVND